MQTSKLKSHNPNLPKNLNAQNWQHKSKVLFQHVSWQAERPQKIVPKSQKTIYNKNKYTHIHKQQTLGNFWIINEDKFNVQKI